jgi:hypothetical protein
MWGDILSPNCALRITGSRRLRTFQASLIEMKQTTTPLRLLALTVATFFLFACTAPSNGANSSSRRTVKKGQNYREPESKPAPEPESKPEPMPESKPVPEPEPQGRVITLGESLYSEISLGPFVSWGCREFFSDGPILVEIGRFEAASLSDEGFILYDGSSSGELTRYRRMGVNQRWDWGPNGGEFAFVLAPDGKGLFYDFSDVQRGETTNAESVYKCSRR